MQCCRSMWVLLVFYPEDKFCGTVLNIFDFLDKVSCGVVVRQTDCVPRLDAPGLCRAAERKSAGYLMMPTILLALTAACETCALKLSLLSIRTPRSLCMSFFASNTHYMVVLSIARCPFHVYSLWLITAQFRQTTFVWMKREAISWTTAAVCWGLLPSLCSVAYFLAP